MARENAGEHDGSEAQTTHCLMMSQACFNALSLAIHNLSMREKKLCSPRRILTEVLVDGKSPLFEISVPDLEVICNPDALGGVIKINIRIDSCVNDRLREFRDYAAALVGRPVSVLEAVSACTYAINC